MKKGFTLAEVLITLGIIGVVAALTMPALISNHNKHVVETKLQKFYSTINQAVKMSEVDNGPVEDWDISAEERNFDDVKKFYEKYLANYLKSISYGVEHSVSTTDDGTEVLEEFDSFVVKFADGSVLLMSLSGGVDMGYFLDASKIQQAKNGRDVFNFNLRKNGTVGNKNLVEPYSFGWDGTVEHLTSHPRYGCHKDSYSLAYCAKLIQMNGWKIPDDYPVKF